MIKFKTRQDKWSVGYPFLKTSKRGENYAHCTICNTDFCIGHGGENNVKRHITLNKHIEAASALKSTQRISNFFPGNSANATLDEKVIKAELLFTGFLCEHNLSIATAEYSGKLLKIMFLDSNIAQKYAYGRTKTTHMLSGAAAKESVDNLKTLLNQPDLTKWFGIATDGSSDENDKFLPVLIRHFSKDGLITTSLLDMPDIDKGSDAKTMFDVCSLSCLKANLSWELCCTYSSDNTLGAGVS